MKLRAGVVAVCLAGVGVACGARTGFDLPSDVTTAEPDAGTEVDAGFEAGFDATAPEDASVGPFCTPALEGGPPAALCTTWSAGGEVMVSGSGTPSQMSYFTSVVPSGDGVLASWFTLTGASQSTWVTRRIGFDGTPLGPSRNHLSFGTSGGTYTDVMSLAGNGCAFAGLVDDTVNGCRFLPLDGDGNETGPATTAPGLNGPAIGACFDLGASTNGRFSMLSGPTMADPRVWLWDNLPAAGGAALLPPGFGGLSPRLVFPDGSFLLSTFLETDAGGLATSISHFALGGFSQVGPFLLTDTAYSVLYMAPTADGVLAAWQGDADEQESVIVDALDHDGRPTATPIPVVASESEALYGFAIGSPPAGGDAIVAWQSLVNGSMFHLQIQALGPDGTPRGAPTSIGTYDSLGTIRIVVSADGTRGVLLFSAEGENVPDGMRAVPLVCVQ
jgi:hypothetical protein